MKLGALFLATNCLLTSFPTQAADVDKIVVNNTQYDQYGDLVSLRSQFNTMIGSNEYMANGKYPYQLYGPIVSYSIVLDKLKSTNPETSSRYQEDLDAMIATANNIKNADASPQLDATSNQTIVSSAVATLLAQYDNIKTNFTTLSATTGTSVEATELYNYVTSNSNYIYNVLNTFVFIRKYEVMYVDDAANYCVDVNSITAINETLESLYAMYASINQEFGVDSLSSKVQFGKESKIYDLVWDETTDNLNPLYLYGLALTSTYIPFVTDLSRQDSYQLFFENVTGDSTKNLLDLLQYRKPLYATIGKTAATDALNGQTFNGEPITLSQFLKVFESTNKEIALCLRKDSLADMALTVETTVNGEQSTSGSTPSPDPNASPSPSTSPQAQAPNTNYIQGGNAAEVEKDKVAEKDKYGFTEPVYIAGLIKDNDVSSKKVYTSEEVDYIIRDKSYVRASNFNFGIMYNIVNSANLGQRLTDDMNKAITMDIFGNILTSSGIVILPAMANTTLYDYSVSNYKGVFETANTYSNYFFTENATFKLAYPSIDEYNGSITEMQDSFTNKFTFATNANCLSKTSDISNLNYYLKYMDSKNTKKRGMSWKLWENKVLSTSWDIHYPTFPIYPYQIGKDAKDDAGVRKQTINKGSFSALASKNGWNFTRMDGDQQYILNVGHILVSGPNGDYYDTANVGFSDAVTQGIYDLTKYYLILDKSTGDYDASNPKHNDTMKTSLMKEIALQVSEGSKDVNEMIVGESISDLNFKDGDQGWFTSTVSSWGEGLHFGISKNTYLGSILYTPNLDELPLIDRLIAIVKPILIVLAIFGVFGLLLSWRPFGLIRTFPRFIFKLLIYFSMVAAIGKLMPSFITFVINKPVNLIYSDVTLTNSMTDLEIKEKNIKTAHFKGYSEIDTTQSSSYIILSELDLDQYKQIYETVYGSSGFITEFGFLNYFNTVTKTKVYNNLYLQGNKLCMSVDDVYSSSTIKAYQSPSGNDVNTKQFIVPTLKQTWYQPTELHYFTPYFLMTENLLHVLNTVTTETKGKVFPLDYSSGVYKVTGFLRNYMKSNYYLKTSSERMKLMNQLSEEIAEAKDVIANGGNANMTLDDAIKEIKFNQEIIGIITGIDATLRTNQDFLGIMKWSGIHSNGPSEKPFGADVVDDISLQNQILGVAQPNADDARSLENTKTSWWYNNEYFNKARWELEKISKDTVLPQGDVNLIINGRLMTPSVPVKMVNDRLYVLPESLTTGIPKVNYGVGTNGSAVIYTPSNVVDIVKDGAPAGTVMLYCNNAYLGTVASIEVDGKTLVALTNTQGSLDTTNGGSLSNALNADIYYNQDYNSVMVFYPEMSYYGNIGTCYTKILKVNDSVRGFMNSVYDITLNISDENLLKAVALNATMEFNNEFSTSEHELYPKSLEMSSLNFDILLKQLLVPDITLARDAKAQSLYNYIATVGGVIPVLCAILFEILLVVMIVLKDFLLGVHTVLLPLLTIIFYIFSSKWFYKPWLGTLISFLGVAIINIITTLGFLIVNSMTSNNGSDITFALLVGIIVAVVGIVGYGYLWYFLFKDIKNLGYVKAKGFLENKFSKIVGKLHFGKDKGDKAEDNTDADDVVSARLNDVGSASTSRLGAVERYQSDIKTSGGVLSSRLDINSETTSASTLSKTLSESGEPVDSSVMGDRFSQITPTGYSDLAQSGVLMSRTQINELSKTQNLKHGKDYQTIGNSMFVTNKDAIAKSGLQESYSVVSPYSKDLAKELDKEGTPYSVEKDMVRYVSSTPTGKATVTSAIYEDGTLKVPSNAVNTVKDYLKSQNVDFKQKGNTFSIREDAVMTDNMRQEISRISQPLKVKPQRTGEVGGMSLDDETVVSSPDAILSDVKEISNRITKVESNYSKRSVSSINSKSINKLFKPDQEVYTYSLHLDKDTKLSPLINDLHQIANKIESNTARNKALTLRTTDGISVVFESQEDYDAFKHKFTEATTDYFVRPTVYANGNDVAVYTLNGNNLETKQMTLEEFNASELKGVNCRKLK